MNNELGPCPICGRVMIDNLTSDEHHLVPKEFGGNKHPIILIHRICHTKIHSSIPNRELWHTYNNVDSLREHPDIEKFIKWVRKKDPEYMDKNIETNNKRNKRRR